MQEVQILHCLGKAALVFGLDLPEMHGGLLKQKQLLSDLRAMGPKPSFSQLNPDAKWPNPSIEQARFMGPWA